MKLRRVRIEQLRQFREPVEIGPLNPGLNLFVGPNESGKSTVVQAIRAAFFERCKSSSVVGLQPWGDSAASPEVQLEFDWQGETWRLTKSFLRRKRCDLEVGGQRFSGDEAEEKLAALLGFEYAGKGASRAEHWGVPGLLWIEQGQGQEIEAPVQHAGRYLKSVLGDSLGEVASTAGDGLIAGVEQALFGLVTARKHTPTGDYAKALSERDGCVQHLEALRQEVAQYEAQVDQLAKLQALRQQDADRPWEGYRRQAADRQAQLDEVQHWVQARDRDRQSLEHARSSQALCQGQLDGFAAEQRELAQRTQAREQASAAFAAQEQAGGAVLAALARAQEAFAAAEAICRVARQEAQRAELQRDCDRLAHEMADLREQVERARALSSRAQQLRSELLMLRVDETALKRLRDQDRALAEIRVREQAVATRLHFDLLPGSELRLGGKPLVGQGERLLLEATNLEIPGVGVVQVRPGGEDLSDLARHRRAAESALASLLQTLGAADPAAAEAQALQRRDVEAELRSLQAQLERLAPRGLDELQAQLALQEQRGAGLRGTLLQLPEAASGTIPSVDAAQEQLDQAVVQLRQAERAVASHEQALELARQASKTAGREWQRVQDSITAPQRRVREAELVQRLAALRAEQAGLEAAVQQRSAQIDAANPELLAQDLARLGATADQMQAAAQQRALDVAALQSRLETLGAQGLEEAQAAETQKFEALVRRCDELGQRVAALDLLHRLLVEGRLAWVRRIQEPLLRRMQHYLQVLFPQARLRITEDLVPHALLRPVLGDERQEEFAGLSFGAREQVALISRLAYADLLREAGQPTLILLDDALVNSDAARLLQMKRILFDAGQRHQVLIFTCHPQAWHDLGVAPVEMQSLRQRAD